MTDEFELGSQELLHALLTGRKKQRRDINAYRRHFRDRLTLAALTCFRWEGIGEHAESRFVEKTLLTKGLGVFYVQAAGELADVGGDGVLEIPRFTFREATAGGKLTDQWVTSEYRTLQPGGSGRLIRTAGELSRWTGVPVYDNIEHDSYTRQTIRFYAERLAQAALTVDVNSGNTRTQRIITVEQEQAKAAQMLDDLIGSGNGTAILKGSRGKSLMDLVQVLDLGIDPAAVESAHGLFVRILGEAYNALGIQAEANEKAAQQTVDEVNSDDSLIASIRLARFDSRRWAADKINKRFNMCVQVIDSGTGR